MQPELVSPAGEGGLMGGARRLAYRFNLPTTFVKFLIVGGIGFVINQFFLFLFYDTGIAWFLPPQGTETTILGVTIPDTRLLLSSIMAVEIAIVAQFNFHERWTFRKRSKNGNILMRFGKFNLSSAISPIIVVATVTVLTPVIWNAVGEDSTLGHLAPYIANTIGVLLGFFWNWTLNSLIIWPHFREREPVETAEA